MPDYKMAAIGLLDWCLGSLTTRDITVLCAGLPVVFHGCSAVHELGHVVCGRLYGATAVRLRIGMGPLLTLARGTRCPIDIGLLPFTGHVKFSHLPLSRNQRIAMYASGSLATALAAVLLWFCIPSQAWLLRAVTIAFFLASTIDNLGSKNPEGDGAAIRGLLNYSRASAEV